MAAYRTLDLFLTKLNSVRLGHGNYRTTATMVDWDDGVETEIVLSSPGPIIAISTIKMRMQTEETIETPEEGSAAAL